MSRTPSTLSERLNAALTRMTSRELLNNEGIGNEVGFYIFDYPPEQELKVRHWLTDVLPGYLLRSKPDLDVLVVNLFRLVVTYLDERKILAQAYDMQKKRGNDALARALSGPLNETRLCDYLVRKHNPAGRDLVLMHGVGECWPILRSHALLNNLHSRMGFTPLVMFYPGTYTTQALSLFGKLPASNYYRAFRLVP